VGVWDTGERRLLFLSVDGQRANDHCLDATGQKPPVTPIVGAGQENGRFEGIRIFDVTDPANPTYLRAVFTDCGSHTHTVLPVRQTAGSGDDREFVLDAENPDRVFIYVSSYPLLPLGGGAYRCVDTTSGPGQVVDPTHNKISIVEVPFSDPTQADVLREVPLHPQTLGFPTQESRGCHDIGVFLELKLAAAACQGEGQIWDISDPANPDTMGAQRIENPNINYWHSGSFSWDGRYAIYGDEEGGAVITHGCFNASEQQGAGTGATWFYDRNDVSNGFDINTGNGSFVQDRPQFEGALVCTAHNYISVPVANRQLLVSAYYEAGTSMLDYTDIKRIEEVAYFDAQGVDADGTGGTNPAADTWSSYWYNGNPFANDIARGVDIFAPTGDAARLTAGAKLLDHLNPQTQQCLVVTDADDPDDCDVPKGPAGGGPGGPGPGDPGAQNRRCTNRIDGSDGRDKIQGSKSADRIVGMRGNDRLDGEEGDDCLLGKGGRDRLRGDAGNDELRGGGARDRIKGNSGNDEVRPGRGKDRIRAGSGDDVIHAARGARDRIHCGRGEDLAIVNERKDRVARNCEAVKDRSRHDFATAAHLQSH